MKRYGIVDFTAIHSYLFPSSSCASVLINPTDVQEIFPFPINRNPRTLDLKPWKKKLYLMTVRPAGSDPVPVGGSRKRRKVVASEEVQGCRNDASRSGRMRRGRKC